MSKGSKKFARWCVKHKLPAILIFGFSYAIVFFALLFYLLHAPLILAIIFAVFLFLCVAIVMNSAFNVLLTNAAKELNENCDIRPLMEETEFLLTCKLSEYNRHLLIIDCCAVQLELGEYQKAFDVITSINIDKNQGMLPIYKIVYYINLTSACIRIGRYEEARIWHDKMCSIFDDMKDNKQKRAMIPVINSLKARMAFASGDSLNAIRILNTIKPENLYAAVHNSLLSAKAYLALGDKQSAAERLQFVINKGNTLYAVTEAKNLLNDCTEKETDWL